MPTNRPTDPVLGVGSAAAKRWNSAGVFRGIVTGREHVQELARRTIKRDDRTGPQARRPQPLGVVDIEVGSRVMG